MTSGVKIVLVSILSLILIFLIGILTFGILNKDKLGLTIYSFDNMKDLTVVKSETFDATSINHFKISTTSADIRFVVSEDNSFKVEQYAKSDLESEYYFGVTNAGGTLSITENQRKINFSFFGWGYRGSLFIVHVPADYANQFTINTVSADVEMLPALNVSELTVKTTSGEIDFASPVTTNKFEFTSVSGDVELTEITGNGKIKTTSGQIEADLMNGLVECSSVSGDIKVGHLIQGGEFKTTSGSVRFEQFNISANTKITSVSGDVKIGLTADSNYQITTKTVSGDVKYPSRGTVYGEARSDLDIKTTSGNIHIN